MASETFLARCKVVQICEPGHIEEIKQTEINQEEIKKEGSKEEIKVEEQCSGVRISEVEETCFPNIRVSHHNQEQLLFVVQN